jgi:hypothetical protein
MRQAQLLIAIGVVLLSSFLSGSTRAEEAVRIGGALAILDKPARASGSVILVPGGDGVLGITPEGAITRLRGNQLVRTRRSYAASGFATLTIDQGVDLSAAVQYMRAIAKPVVVVGTSRGTLRAASFVSGASGAGRPDGLVLTAGFYGAGQSVQSAVGSPDRLPPTLVVHHRKDACRLTRAEDVAAMQQWGGSRVRVVWLDGGPGGEPACEARSYHGFAGIDGQVVSAVVRFARSVR